MTNLNTKLANYIERIAINFAREKSIAQEYLWLIIALSVTRIATSVFSVVSGYYFAVDFIGDYGIFTPIFSYFMLAAIEISTIIVLMIAGKMLYNMNRYAFVPILISIVLFSVSFHIVTTGKAKKDSDNVNQIAIIENSYESEKATINKEFEQTRTNLMNLINNEIANPQGWQNGQRTSLTPIQLNNIKEYNQDIYNADIIRQEKISALNVNTELKKDMNNKTVQSASKKFWKYSVSIMVAQLISNLFLAFFYVAIRNEKEPEEVKNERLNRLKNKKNKIAFNWIFTNEEKKIHDFELNQILTDGNVKILTNETKQTPEPVNEINSEPANELYRKTSIGFTSKKAPESIVNTDKLTPPVNSEKLTAKDVKKTAVNKHDYGHGYCRYCMKEYKRNAHNSEFCSNSHRVLFHQKAKKLND